MFRSKTRAVPPAGGDCGVGGGPFRPWLPVFLEGGASLKCGDARRAARHFCRRRPGIPDVLVLTRSRGPRHRSPGWGAAGCVPGGSGIRPRGRGLRAAVAGAPGARLGAPPRHEPSHAGGETAGGRRSPQTLQRAGDVRFTSAGSMRSRAASPRADRRLAAGQGSAEGCRAQAAVRRRPAPRGLGTSGAAGRPRRHRGLGLPAGVPGRAWTALRPLHRHTPEIGYITA